MLAEISRSEPTWSRYASKYKQWWHTLKQEFNSWAEWVTIPYPALKIDIWLNDKNYFPVIGLILLGNSNKINIPEEENHIAQYSQKPRKHNSASVSVPSEGLFSSVYASSSLNCMNCFRFFFSLSILCPIHNFIDIFPHILWWT